MFAIIVISIFISDRISINKLIGNNIDYMKEVIDVVDEYEECLSKAQRDCYNTLDESQVIKRIIKDSNKH